MVFNIKYNAKGSVKPKKEASNPLFASLAKHIDDSSEPKNIVRMDIDYSDIKTLAPHFDPRSSQDLVGIATELSNAIQISKEGELLVNSSKLNPAAVKLLENRFSLQKSEAEDQTSSRWSGNDHLSKRTVLIKRAKVCGDQKYLFVISSMEKMAPNYEAENRGTIDIFQEYEVYLEIAASSLTNTNKPKITWELTVGEAQRLINLTDPMSIAREIASSIQIFDDKFLLPIPRKTNSDYEKAIIINELTLMKIQRRIRTRKFKISYNAYMQEMKNLSASILYKSIFELDGVLFMIVCLEESKERFAVLAWDTVEYQKYRLSVDKSIIQKFYEKDPVRAFRVLMRNLLFEHDSASNFKLAYNKKSLQQDLANQH